ncbi:hypothetical protein ARAM_007159 [Aspergillus rambellii]|uniref:SMP-LTD domain-containing protein n=1 Tax=Aspergillus rambellii TaxID=308745 RepID=A0A0F8X5R3_9EURO|nr:hypothetical protein ARAM_007159 [Aspergillus rambellii]
MKARPVPARRLVLPSPVTPKTPAICWQCLRDDLLLDRIQCQTRKYHPTRRKDVSPFGAAVSAAQTLFKGLPKAPPGISVDPLRMVGKELKFLTKNIRQLLGSGHPTLDKVAKYYTRSEGKHMRPLLVLLMSQATALTPRQGRAAPTGSVPVNDPISSPSILADTNPDLHPITSSSAEAKYDFVGDENILPSQRRLAEITELIHTASLLHDDVIDNAVTRRSFNSANIQFGNKMAVLAGDFLLGRASVALARLRDPEVTELLATVIANLVEGEFMQLKNTAEDEKNPVFTDETISYYLQKTYLKTASLISKSCRAAALLGNSTPEVVESAYSYGRNLGLAFQLVDDMLDYTVSGVELGKPAGADLELGLATAPLLFAWKQNPELGPLVGRKFSKEGDVQKARELVYRSNGVEQTRALAQEYADKARSDRLAPPMGLLGSFLFIYCLGGLTFFPLLLLLFLLYSYLILPPPPPPPSPEHASESVRAAIRRSNDDQYSLKSGTDELAEKFHRTHETDVAAGYFAVCREYVPGGVNGKPPERTTPAGEVIAAESPSVYQTMYRSLFDRKQTPTIEPVKNTAKNGKRGRNVFYIVLRHGHLMLYDDVNQVEVRYVISLAHHDVSIYGGEEGEILEGELWLKRNAISLSRRLDSLGDLGGPTPPFFLFSENLSEKEDFYFAMLQNQAKLGNPPDAPPKQQGFDVKHIVTLVQRLHSSEEQLQTRWINAVLGRLFLALYRTPEMEEFVRKKIVKKISRVNKPNFISKLGLQRIDMGNGAPFIINPRLKDLTVDGNCCVETDVQYTGNFRVEISATVRIDLGQRFKAREVDIVLAVVLKKLEGHMLIRFKPPPSNRAWISFESMPNMVMDIEPIVSSKQITYGIILRTIESKIREMVAESIVQPFWDDVPFLDTLSQRFRGGIWERDISKPESPVDIPDESESRPQGPEGERDESISVLKTKDDRTMSAPALAESLPIPVKSRKGSKRSSVDLDKGTSTGLSTSPGKMGTSPPRAIRSQTFSHAADPVVTADHGKMDRALSDYKREDQSHATSAMIEISNRSLPASPNKTPNSSPPTDGPGIMETAFVSREPSISESIGSGKASPTRPSSAHTSDSSLNKRSTVGSLSSSFGSNKARRRSTLETLTRSINSSTAAENKPQASLSLSSATSMAKKWGWNVFGKGDSNTQGPSRPAGTPEEPIGRGHPFPPPGTPLPTPAKVNRKKNSVSLPKRKPVPPPHFTENEVLKENQTKPHSKSPLPRRKPVLGLANGASQSDEVLVVQAPPYDSAPNSPVDFAPNPAVEPRAQSHSSLTWMTRGDTEARSSLNIESKRDDASDQHSTARCRDIEATGLRILSSANEPVAREEVQP